MAWSVLIEQGSFAFDPTSLFTGIVLAVLVMMVAFAVARHIGRATPPEPLVKVKQAMQSTATNRSKREFAQMVLQELVNLTGAEAAGIVLDSGSNDESDLYSLFSKEFRSDIIVTSDRVIPTRQETQKDGSTSSVSNTDYQIPLNLPSYYPPVRAATGIAMQFQGRRIGELFVLNKPRGFNTVDKAYLATLSAYASQILGNYLLVEQADLGYVATIEMLIKAIESKDSYIRGHSERVANYAVAIAKEMDLPRKQIEQIRTGALLHDIGWINVPEEIANKQGPLTEEEWKRIKDHPGFGKKAVDSFSRSRDLLLTIYHHHEAYDGSGYPSGLKGNEIPLAARIIKVADAFDAMTSDRPYREKKSVVHAIEELLDESGREFDPLAVASFVRSLKNKVNALV